jgi:hypothetical protein
VEVFHLLSKLDNILVRLQFLDHRKKRHPDMWFGTYYYSCYPCQCVSMSCKDMQKHEARVNKTANVMVLHNIVLCALCVKQIEEKCEICKKNVEIMKHMLRNCISINIVISCALKYATYHGQT